MLLPRTSRISIPGWRYGVNKDPEAWHPLGSVKHWVRLPVGGWVGSAGVGAEGGAAGRWARAGAIRKYWVWVFYSGGDWVHALSTGLKHRYLNARRPRRSTLAFPWASLFILIEKGSLNSGSYKDGVKPRGVVAIAQSPFVPTPLSDQCPLTLSLLTLHCLPGLCPFPPCNSVGRAVWIAQNSKRGFNNYYLWKTSTPECPLILFSLLTRFSSKGRFGAFSLKQCHTPVISSHYFEAPDAFRKLTHCGHSHLTSLQCLWRQLFRPATFA